MQLLAENLCRFDSFAHGFFTREGGVSTGIYASLNCGPGSGDVAENVAENRRRALRAMGGMDSARLVTAYQVHSAIAVEVTRPWAAGEAPRADALATKEPGVALGILTADCAPVLFLDAEATVAGAAHAGWRGALSGVVESAIALMESLGATRNRIAAAVGPCIGQANYEVGAEFRETFLAVRRQYEDFFAKGRDGVHWQFDLAAFVRHRLEQARIGNICDLARCTYASEAEFFSFRRNTHHGETNYGRQLSAIALL